MNIETIDRIIVKPEFIERLHLKKFDIIKESSYFELVIELMDPCELLSDCKNFLNLNSWFRYNNLIMINWDFFTSIETGNIATFFGSFIIDDNVYDPNEIKENLGF